MLLRVKNQTSVALPLINLSVPNGVLPPDMYVSLTPYNKIYEIQTDPQLRQYIVENSCVLNDGERDLSQEEALNVATPVVSTASILSFTAAPEKEFVHENDIFLVEDSEDLWKKKKVKSSNVIFVGAGTIVYTPEYFVETRVAYTKSTSPIILHGMEKKIAEDGHYEVEFSGQFGALDGKEFILIAVFLDENLVLNTVRILEAESYETMQTDALLFNAKGGQAITIRWWSSRGKQILAIFRSMKVRRFI